MFMGTKPSGVLMALHATVKYRAESGDAKHVRSSKEGMVSRLANFTYYFNFIE